MITHSESRRPIVLAVIAAGLIISAAMGIRQTFGLFLGPFAFDRGLPVTTVAFAIALHNLTWGLAQPVAGMAADRHGPMPVVATGALLYALGLTLAAQSGSGAGLVLGMGVLVGLGISCTTFGVVMTAIGKMARPEQRSTVMGLASAAGSLGQVGLVPVAQMTNGSQGMAFTLLLLAAVILAAAPFGLLLGQRARGPAPKHVDGGIPLARMAAIAGRHGGYRLLTLGFFACGFQLAFIGTHLPGYLSLCQMPASLGATALALIGLFNMAGSWLCGWLGSRFNPAKVLGCLYLLRGVIITAFVAGPKSEAAVLVFAALMGLTWLGTVPLTSGLIARMFGTRHLGTLFGICFLSHQVGSFLGAWLGGLVLDLTGSYTLIWTAIAASGLAAALLHFPIAAGPAALAGQEA